MTDDTPCELCMEPSRSRICPACTAEADLGREVRGSRVFQIPACHVCAMDVSEFPAAHTLLVRDGRVAVVTFTCRHWEEIG